MEVAGPLGTPLGLAQRKRASPRGEAGTSGFLCVSDSDRRVPAELGQESQASSCLRKGSPPIVSLNHMTHSPILKDKFLLKYVLTCFWFCVINFDIQ